MTELNFFLLLGLTLLIGAIIVQFSVRRQQLFQYPLLMALVFGGWVLPQLIGLYVTETVPPDALAKTIVFVALCLVAGVWGYSSTRSVSPMARWELSHDRLQLGALVLMLFGIYFYLRVSALSAEATALYGGFWTGRITIFVFFSTTLIIGFICAIAAYVQRPTLLNRGMILVGILMFLQRIVIYGRREVAIELFTILLLFLWQKYRWLPGRWTFFATVVAGALFVNAVGFYRELMINPETQTWSGATLSDVLAIDFVGNFTGAINDPTANQELKNAVMIIGASDSRMSFDGGISLWNHLIFSFVPGQIVGSELKANLMVDLPNLAYEVYGHRAFPGTTSTGFAVAFKSFWYFGALLFFTIGYIMRRWTNAYLQRSITGLIMLMMLTSQSLMAITHTTNDFVSIFVSIGIFLLPVLIFARRKVRRPINAT